MKEKLKSLGLTPSNSIVVGSRILQALGIRKSGDIDLVVTQDAYTSLKKMRKFSEVKIYGRNILKDKTFEIGTDWKILGRSYWFKDFISDSLIINGIRYITLDLLYRVKKDWIEKNQARPKDIKDVKLMEEYINKLKKR